MNNATPRIRPSRPTIRPAIRPRIRHGARASHSIEHLEPRRLLAATPVDAASAIPFQHVVIDANPGTTPVIKLMGDVNADGKQDAIIGFETASGGPGGIYWYQFPSNGNVRARWNRYAVVPTGDAYESAVTTDLNGDRALDLVISYDDTIVWFENPMGSGKKLSTTIWPKHFIGTDTAHEMSLVDVDGDGRNDIVTNHTIFFQDSATSWTQLDSANLPRDNKGLAMFDSGSGNGAIDIVGTSQQAPRNITWWENPRDHGGDARSDPWSAHRIGDSYDPNDGGLGISYATMDVNGDGRQDVITSEGEVPDGQPRTPGGMVWWEAPANRATGAWTRRTIDADIQDVHNIRTADVNRDGQTDIVFAEQDQSDQKRVGILFNPGQRGRVWQMQVLGTIGGEHQWVADDNGDGYPDILSAPHGFYSGYNPIELWQNRLPQAKAQRPTITQQPTTKTVSSGGNATFVVTARSNKPIAYQWLKNNVPIKGATSAKYVYRSVDADDDGASLRVIVSTAAGYRISNTATLRVK